MSYTTIELRAAALDMEKSGARQCYAPLLRNAADYITQLEEALEWYADTFCEYGTSNTICGKYGSDVCSGCKARALVGVK